MTTGLSTELRIPDLWYDFYSRLVPGAAFVAAVYILRPGAAPWPSTLQAVLLGIAGYFVAMVTQPLSSLVTGRIHDRVANKSVKDRLYVRRVARKVEPNQQQILDKMHGETTLFVQLSVFSLLLTGHQILVAHDGPAWWWFVVAGIVFLFEAFEVARRRVKRAQDLLAVLSSTTGANGQSAS